MAPPWRATLNSSEDLQGQLEIDGSKDRKIWIAFEQNEKIGQSQKWKGQTMPNQALVNCSSCWVLCVLETPILDQIGSISCWYSMEILLANALSEVIRKSIEIHDQRIQHPMLREASGQATRPWKKKEEGQPFAVNKNRPESREKMRDRRALLLGHPRASSIIRNLLQVETCPELWHALPIPGPRSALEWSRVAGFSAFRPAKHRKTQKQKASKEKVSSCSEASVFLENRAPLLLDMARLTKVALTTTEKW